MTATAPPLQTIDTIDVTVMDKHYQIKCPADKAEELRESSHYLDAKMKEMRQSGQLQSLDRLAVITALNITHDLISQKNKTETLIQQTNLRIQHMYSKIQSAIVQ